MKQLQRFALVLIALVFFIGVLISASAVDAAPQEPTPLPLIFTPGEVIVECGVGFARWRNWETTSITYTLSDTLTVYADAAVNGSAIMLLVATDTNVQMADIYLVPEDNTEVSLYFWTSEVTAIAFPFRRCGENLYFGEAYLFETEVSTPPTATPSP